MEIQPLPLSLFVSRLKERKPFAMVRYGDGEFLCVTGAQGRNCDLSDYTPDLSTALALTLTHQRHGDYFYCLGPKASSGMKKQVNAWLAEYAPALQFYDSETFLTASLRGELYPLIHRLNRRRVVIVGAPHLARLWENNLMRQPQAHIVTPAVNAWLDKERIARDILRYANPTNPHKKADVVLFSTGMLSKVLCWILYPIIGAHTSLWDTGSVFDLVVGVNSRSYARRMPHEKKVELVCANYGVSQEIAERSLRGKVFA